MAQTVLGMVVDLLDISRSEDGTLEPKLAEVDVPTFVTTLADSMRAGCEADGNHQIAVDVELDAPEARFDVSLIRRVLANLIDNASRFAPRGSTLRIVARGDASSLELRVCDHGRGVPDADKARVFSKYVQLEAPQSSHNRGLGLVFCKLAIAAHGGEIWVEDNLPTGSQFCVRFPR